MAVGLFKKKPFTPPADFYYLFYQMIRPEIYMYRERSLIFRGNDYEEFLVDADYGYAFQDIPTQYCPNLGFCAAKVIYEEENNDEDPSFETYETVKIEVCVIGNEIRCYLHLQFPEEATFVERLSYQINVDVVVPDGKNMGCKETIFIPRNKDLFLLDVAENLIVYNEDKTAYSISEKGIEGIVKKIAEIGQRLIDFAEKEDYFVE